MARLNSVKCCVCCLALINFSSFCCLSYFQTGSHLSQADLETPVQPTYDHLNCLIFLSPFPKCIGYRMHPQLQVNGVLPFKCRTCRQGVFLLSQIYSYIIMGIGFVTPKFQKIMCHRHRIYGNGLHCKHMIVVNRLIIGRKMFLVF